MPARARFGAAVLCGLCVLLHSSCVTATEPRVFRSASSAELPYRWHAPDSPAPGKRYPLVLFLHGAGERGDDNRA